MRPPKIEQIRKLWILELVVRGGSLRKAALSAKVSPSAVSQTISALERSIGRPLLVRGRDSAVPTPEAREILDTVRPAFEVFDRLRDLGRAPAPKLSWLNFGTYESIAVDILPGLIHSLRRRMPHLRLKLRISRTPVLLGMLRKGELSTALVTETDDLGRLDSREIANDRLGLFVSRRHEIGKLGWRAIEKHGVGSLSPGSDGLPRYFKKYVHQLEPMKPMILSDSFEALRVAAVAGSLVSILPCRVANRTEELSELIPPAKAGFQEKGEHRICLVSSRDSGAEELDFLAQELTRLYR